MQASYSRASCVGDGMFGDGMEFLRCRAFGCLSFGQKNLEDWKVSRRAKEI